MVQETTYAQLAVHEPEKTGWFMVKYLGFVQQTDGSADKKDLFLRNEKGNSYWLSSWNNYNELSTVEAEIVVNTNDCIRDHCLLTIAGIAFEKKPRYTAKGLEAVFIDDNKNRYRLVEERNYTDDIS